MEKEKRIGTTIIKKSKGNESSLLTFNANRLLTRRKFLTRMGQSLIGGLLLGVGVTDYSTTQKEEKIIKKEREIQMEICEDEKMDKQIENSNFRRKINDTIIATSGVVTVIFSMLNIKDE